MEDAFEKPATSPKGQLELFLEDTSTDLEGKFAQERSAFVSYLRNSHIQVSGEQFQDEDQKKAFAESVKELTVIKRYGRALMEDVEIRDGNKNDPILKRIRNRFKGVGISSEQLNKLPDAANQLYASTLTVNRT